MLDGQGLDPLRAQAVGRGLGAEVARDLARAAEVRADHREEVAVDLAALHEPHRRDDQPLLVDLARHPDAAGSAASHVHVVRDVRHVAEERPLVEHGGDERDVVQVHAAQVRVVDEDAVAGGQPLGPVGRDGLRHDVGERAQVRGLGEGLGDGAQVAVEERAGEVAAGLDVGRVGGAPERRPHLLGDGEERVADDLEPDGIDVGGEGAGRGRSRHGQSGASFMVETWAAITFQPSAGEAHPGLALPADEVAAPHLELEVHGGEIAAQGEDLEADAPLLDAGSGRPGHPVGVDLAEAVAVLVERVADGVRAVPEGRVEHVDVLVDQGLLVALEQRAHLGHDLRQIGGQLVAGHSTASMAFATATSVASAPRAARMESPTGSPFT